MTIFQFPWLYFNFHDYITISPTFPWLHFNFPDYISISMTIFQFPLTIFQFPWLYFNFPDYILISMTILQFLRLFHDYISISLTIFKFHEFITISLLRYSPISCPTSGSCAKVMSSMCYHPINTSESRFCCAPALFHMYFNSTSWWPSHVLYRFFPLT